jgi:hypothetical protein
MNIISFDSARATWLFPLEEFAPSAGLNSVLMVTKIAERYGFGQIPTITTRDDMAKNGITFGMGHFETKDARFIVTDFMIYNDGIVAAAEKSEWAESFLQDVSSWAIAEFGFREPVTGIGKLAASTLVIDFEKPISKLLASYDLISEIISSRTVTIVPQPKPMQLSRLAFEIDKAYLVGQVAQPKFILERRGGVSFSQERYFSTAPMHTQGHIETLMAIETLARDL